MIRKSSQKPNESFFLINSFIIIPLSTFLCYCVFIARLHLICYGYNRYLVVHNNSDWLCLKPKRTTQECLIIVHLFCYLNLLPTWLSYFLLTRTHIFNEKWTQHVMTIVDYVLVWGFFTAMIVAFAALIRLL